jgi:hypothetical protein
MRVNLRGHVLLSERAILQGGLTEKIHVFGEDAWIPVGMYILLSTGHGEPRWTKTKEASMVYHSYMGRDCCVWDEAEAPLHVLSTQHSFTARKENSAYAGVA